MGAPNIFTKIIDKSQRVPGTTGVYGAIVIPAPKGEINVPTLVTSDIDLLKKYTENEKVEIGYDNSFFSALSFLKESDKLWVVRAANSNAMYGGSIIKAFSSSNSNASLGTGLIDPSTYTFSSTAIITSAEVTDFTCEADVNDSLNGKILEFSSPNADYYAWFNTGTSVDPVLSGKTGVEVTISTNDIDTNIATSLSTAINTLTEFTVPAPVGNVVTITNNNNGTVKNAPSNGNTGWQTNPSITTIGTDADITDDSLLIYGINQGSWNNNISTKITTYHDEPNVVKDSDAYLIEVYYNGVKKEEFKCSNIPGKKDGSGNNLFVEDVLESSAYIRALVSGGDLIYPKGGTVALGAGNNGTIAGTSDMITASNTLRNKNIVTSDILLDGGYAVPAYGKNLISIAEERQDSVAILSTPTSSETNSDYINEIINYRKFVLNANNKFGSMFSSLVKIYDYFNDREIWISSDGFIGGAISAASRNYEIWYPIIGFTRGILNVLDVYHRYNQAEMDLLYDAQINPIRFAPGKGIVIWGQKTLQNAPSAFDRLNVMLLTTNIIPPIQEYLDTLIGELNTSNLRSNVELIIGKFFENIKSRKGVTDYNIVCSNTNNTPQTIGNNELHVDGYFLPTKSVEYIYFSLIAMPEGVSLEIK